MKKLVCIAVLVMGIVVAILVVQPCLGKSTTQKQFSIPAIDVATHACIATPVLGIDDQYQASSDDGSLTGTTQSSNFLRVLKGPEKEAAEFYAKQMESANVACILLMGGVGIEGDPLGIERSLRIAKLLAEYSKPKLVKVIGAADPSNGLSPVKMKAVREQLDKHRSEIVAFKVYLGFHGRPTDHGYEPFYKLALECNLPVVFHTGDSWGHMSRALDSNPLLVDEVARKYPKLRIVLSHMGVGQWHIEAAVMMWRRPNVYVDLSGFYVGTDEPLLEMVRSGPLRTIPLMTIMSDVVEGLTMVNAYDRVLYGSSAPMGPSMAAYREYIEALIPKEHHEKVFRTNAEKLFGVKLQALAVKDK